MNPLIPLVLALAAPPAAGVLRVTHETPPKAVDLSSLGAADWCHWGLLKGTTVVHRKDAATPLIGDLVKLGDREEHTFENNVTAFGWSGGRPTSDVAKTQSGLFTYGKGNGFAVTLPAGTCLRTARVYAGVWRASGKLEAALSDGSAPALAATAAPDPKGEITNVVFTLNYRAASDGQALTVRWTNPGAGGNVEFLAVALADGEPKAAAAAPGGHVLAVRGTRFLLDGRPFPYTGVSFFNAIYNPAFNRSPADRRAWLAKFKRYGVNVLRVWGQWDNKRGFADAGPDATLFHPNGKLRAEHLKTLKDVLTEADAAGVVVQLCLFAQESRKDGIALKPEAADHAVAALARELKPFRNLAFQVWNEHSERTVELLKVIKAEDRDRLVTSSPGVAGVLGSDAENRALDYLTPHTSRYNKGRPWEIAPPEIEGLLARFGKPVVDDEPARNGTPKFGGPKAGSAPADHILQIWRVWQAGGYVTYHHDMFQTGYGTPAVPPGGVPDPEFSPYHKQVFEFLRDRDRYLPAARPAFPLRASDSGRYLVDRAGTPFLVHADTGWRAIMALTADGAERYFDDRAARGFTAVHLHAINKEKTGPATRAGHHPFDPPDDLTRPNEAYWAHADAVLQAAADRGLLVVLSSSWFGYNGSGWRKHLTPKSARAYGTFLGKRYRRFDNILWVHAGDNDPGDRAAAVAELAKAIKAEAPRHLHTAHNHPENSSAVHFADADWLDVNMAYTYREADLQVATEYARKGKVRPVYLGETGYEGESNTKFLWTPALVRRQPYRALLSGACGHAVGSATVWHFGPGWEKALDKEATRQMAHVKALFTALPWWRLVPDAKGELVVDGRGTPGKPDFAPAARADDGSFALVYLPTPRAVTVDVSKLTGKRLKAWWFNPRDGKVTAAGAPAGRHRFRPPSEGAEDDWVLIVRDGAGAFAVAE